jgi:hypothetical protein
VLQDSKPGTAGLARAFPAGHSKRSFSMSDDLGNVGQRDRDRVSGGEGYEVEHFAQKHGISIEQARELIARVGNDRAALDAAAEQMKGR